MFVIRINQLPEDIRDKRKPGPYYLANIRGEGVYFTPFSTEAERFSTELNAKVAGCYMPEVYRGLWEIVPV